MGNKTSKKDFELYKKECLKWIKVFGLLDWEPYFDHNEKVTESTARCSFNHESKNVTFTLFQDWEGEIISCETINMCAFHEVMELLLCKMTSLCHERFITENEIQEATHAIIRRLENVVYPKLK